MTAVLLRVYLMGGKQLPEEAETALAIVAVASMFAGNLLALLQENIKRILAYSSIAHIGYLLVAFLAGGEFAAEAATYYLVAYMVTALGAFGVVSTLSGASGEADRLSHYRGLGWRHPFQAGILTAMLLSLAGIPLTAGFVGKFYLLAAGVEAGTWGLLFCLVAASAIGLYYYLRVVAALYDTRPDGGTPLPNPVQLAFGGGVVLSLLALLLIWFGVFPGGLIELIRKSLVPLV
jgi:NADH-quinone oxidoreductase subunit N